MSTEKQIEKRLLDKLSKELERRLDTAPGDMSAAELELIRKLSGDAGITLASIRAGDWGETARKAAEDVIDEEDFDDISGDVFSNFSGPSGTA